MIIMLAYDQLSQLMTFYPFLSLIAKWFHYADVFTIYAFFSEDGRLLYSYDALNTDQVIKIRPSSV